MANENFYHPAEIACALSFVGAKTVIGWGAELFTPSRGRADAFFNDGIARLKKSKRLLLGKQPGHHRLAEETSRLATTLADPQIVLVTHRREGDGARILTHHLAGTHVVELSLGLDGNFLVTEQASLAGAAGAAAAFVGTAPGAASPATRVEANQKVFAKMKELARTGATPSVVAALKKLGADEVEAKSIAEGMVKPAAAGVVSVLYCAANTAQDAETYAVTTTAAGESWVVFPPATSTGPVVLERTSTSALTARILVAISARLFMPG